MSLNFNLWRPFLVSNVFEILNGKGITKEEIEENPGILKAVQSGEENNGVMGYIDKDYCKNMNYVFCDDACLTVSRSGSAGFVSFQINGCVVGDSAKILLLKYQKPHVEVYLFLQSILSANRYKYSYGRKVTEEKYGKEIIDLPIKLNEDNTPLLDPECKYSPSGYIPDWQFMEDYIKKLHHKPITTQIPLDKAPIINTAKWQDFVFNKVFKLVGGFYNKKPEHSTEGDFPFLGSTDSNNGVTEYYSLEDIQSWSKTGEMEDTLEKKIFEGNCIAVTVNGSVCNAYYQRDKFTCSHDITAFYLKHHEMNVYLAMFLCTIINNEKYRWSYGRKPHDVKKFGKSIVKLPVKCDDTGKPIKDSKKLYSDEGYIPDWEYMENFIKSLPFGDRIK